MWDVVRYRYATAPAGAWARWRVHGETVADLIRAAAGMRLANAWGWGMGREMGRGWGLDARFVWRSLRRSPGYALTAVLVLAGAVAVNTTVFSYVRGTLLADATYPGADRLVVVWGSNAVDGQLRDVISGPTFVDFARETTSLDAIAALHVDGAVLPDADGRPHVVDAVSVSATFFQVVPVKAALGRVFDQRERTSGGASAALVSWAFWRDQLGADPTWLGRSLNINGAPHTLVGVLPEGYEFIVPAPFYLPLYEDELAADNRTRIHYNVMGRLKAQATAGDVTRDLSGAMTRITQRTGSFKGWSVLAEPLHAASVMAVRPVLWTVTAAVWIVLVIALVNLATLFRIRTLGRGDELGVRLALGAGPARVARVLALEAAALALVGALVGLALAAPLLARVRDLLPVYIAIPDSAARVPVLRAVLDPWVASVALVMAVVGALALVTPALAAAVRGRAAAWGGRGRLGPRGVRWLVAMELALATVLCLGAGLTARSASRLLATDVGLRDEGLLTLRMGDVEAWPIEDRITFFRRAQEAVAALPGVQSAALIDYVPFQGEDDFAGIDFLNRDFEPVEHLREEWRRVTLGLFETAGMRILAGRSFESQDFQGKVRAAVVNVSFARKHYPDGNAVGQFLSTHDERDRDLEIVGVVADVLARGPGEPAPPMLYVPNTGNLRGTTGMYVRVAAGPPMAVAEAVREAIWSVDSSQPVADFAPMTELVAAWVAIPRAVRDLVSWVAGLSLLLSAVGVFGVVAFAVRSRSAELGVRLALGASPRRLARDVVSSAVPMLVFGLGGGLLIGYAAARGADAILFGVGPMDPLAVGGTVVAMSAAVLLATYLPARRISRIDPTKAIRIE